MASRPYDVAVADFPGATSAAGAMVGVAGGGVDRPVVAVAWTRLPDFSALQRFTFFPLWLGFILVMNAWSTRRGSSTMLRMPGRWLILFGLSSGFWWGFEWLNRFVRNWHYLGVESFTAPTYALQASLCFATVLPAVLAVREGWTADQAWLAPFERAWSWSRERMRRSAWLLLLVGAGALVLTGAYPEWTYPLLWVAPLLFGLAWAFWWRPDRLRWLQRGDWRPAAAWGAAGLFCGFWWECWNVISLAKWIYTVPYVERWHLFEMPLLGYAGYVPFGWFCGLVAGGLLEPAREPA